MTGRWQRLGWFPAVACFGLVVAAGPVSGQDISTWTGGGSDNNWGTTGNWSGAGVPSGDDGNNVLVFSGTSRPNTVNNLGNWTRSYGEIYFDSGAASFIPAQPNLFFVIVGHNGSEEGSYGHLSSGAERPEASGVATCDYPQDLTGTCDPL